MQMSKVSKRSLSSSCCQFSTIMKNAFFTDLLLRLIVARGVSNVFTGSFENLYILLSSSGSHFASTQFSRNIFVISFVIMEQTLPELCRSGI